MTDVKKFGKVAVMMGGWSSERQASLQSGQEVLEALINAGVNAHFFDPKERSLSAFIEEKFDCAFISLLGRFGEDGTMQGALDLLGIPYTGSGVMASSIGMDKWRTKLLWQAAHMPTPSYEIITMESDFAAIEIKLGLPIMVKPVREGSSIGVSKVNHSGELRSAFEKAAHFDTLVLAEEFIAGTEYTATILGGLPLPLIKLEPRGSFFDYEAKTSSDDDSVDCYCPCGLPEDQEQSIQELALSAFHLLGCDGCARIDLMIGQEGKPYLLEINTCPVVCDDALATIAAQAANLSFEGLLFRMLELAIDKRNFIKP